MFLDVSFNDCVEWMLFVVLIVLDCDTTNTESSIEGKEEKKRVWTKREDDEIIQMFCHLFFCFTENASCVRHEKQASVWIRRG